MVLKGLELYYISYISLEIIIVNSTIWVFAVERKWKKYDDGCGWQAIAVMIRGFLYKFIF